MTHRPRSDAGTSGDHAAQAAAAPPAIRTSPVVQRTVITAAESGLDRSLDTDQRVEFAQAIQEIADLAALERIAGRIDAARAGGDLSTSDVYGLGFVRQRLLDLRALVADAQRLAQVPAGLLGPVEDFPARSYERVGLGELVELGAGLRYPGDTLHGTGKDPQVTWESAYGQGAIQHLKSRWQFQAVATGRDELVCRLVAQIGPGRILAQVPIEVVAPSDGYIEQQPGTKLRKLPNSWGVSFVGEIFLRPSDVSFSALEFKEGPAPAVVTGDWNAGLVPDDPPLGPHKEGTWLPILGPSDGPHPNKVFGDDWISSGGKGNPMTGQASGYSWHIPWLYGWKGQKVVFFTMHHQVLDDGAGGATLSKGGVTVSTDASTEPSWFFTPEQDSARIQKLRPAEWQPRLADWFTEFPYAAAGVHYTLREGLGGGSTLLEIVTQEASYEPGGPERLKALGIT